MGVKVVYPSCEECWEASGDYQLLEPSVSYRIESLVDVIGEDGWAASWVVFVVDRSCKEPGLGED